MKKNYKVKEVNKTKLKSYLKDGNKTNNKGSRRGTDSKRISSRNNNIC